MCDIYHMDGNLDKNNNNENNNDIIVANMYFSGLWYIWHHTKHFKWILS